MHANGACNAAPAINMANGERRDRVASTGTRREAEIWVCGGGQHHYFRDKWEGGEGMGRKGSSST